MRLPILFHAATAFSPLIQKVSSARILSTLRDRVPRHWRERGFLRLSLEQDAQARLDVAGGEPACAESQTTTRVFLVGCERSGTTLLQSLLAAHSNIHSVPETHFVKRLFRNERAAKRYEGPRAWFRRALRNVHALRRDIQARTGWIGERNAEAAWREVDGDPAKPSSFWSRHSARIHMRSFVDAMDAAARHAGKHVWIEKTPEHLFYVALIRRHVPEARFIHIVRDGGEVVASLNRLAQVYPEWRPYLDVTLAAERWNSAWRATSRWIGHPGHLVVRYETLLQAPRQVLARIVRFLDCQPEYDSWKRHPLVAGLLVRSDEPWKAGNFEDLHDCRKFPRSFDAATQASILDALERPGWNALARVHGVIADEDARHDEIGAGDAAPRGSA